MAVFVLPGNNKKNESKSALLSVKTMLVVRIYYYIKATSKNYFANDLQNFLERCAETSL